MASSTLRYYSASAVTKSTFMDSCCRWYNWCSSGTAAVVTANANLLVTTGTATSNITTTTSTTTSRQQIPRTTVGAITQLSHLFPLVEQHYVVHKSVGSYSSSRQLSSSAVAVTSKTEECVAATTGEGLSVVVAPVPPSVSSGGDKQQKNNRLTEALLEELEMPFEGIQAKSFVDKVEFKNTYDGIPILRQLLYTSELVEGVELPFGEEQALEMMKTMSRVTVYDHILYDIQRQGRISFYMTNSGEEASQVGTGAALKNDDILFAQYRELGVLLWRGFSLDQILDQCYGNEGDEGKGRQMPVHYCSRKHNIQAISSPLGTQISQAAGAGYALKTQGKDACAVTYFGEGAASEGDFAVALNFAATLGSQTLFVCRNNGFAISTPVREQYKGDGIAVRGIAYGIDCVRVDGNDIVAVYNATKMARARCVEQQKPVVLELMTYRLGHHSTSDDATRYRMDEESSSFLRDGMNPLGRFKRYLIKQGMYSDEEHRDYIAATRKEVLLKLKDAEKRKSVNIGDGLFGDVYDKPPPHLQQQQQEFKEFYRNHSDKYQTGKFKSHPDFPTTI
eukprot:GHVS01042619.1.p1 GENE.GHVS01042619.1~~GHVS01042619.1.p1  ORF type:complete len:606 (+),score=115.98 GHVS01042619.1:129-1820(+)